MNRTYLERFLSKTSRDVPRNEIRELLKLIARPQVISLAGGLPSPDTFPVKELAQLVPYLLERHGASALQYGPTEGDSGLRRALIDLLVAQEGESFARLEPQQVLVTSASQQGLDLCARVFVDRGDVVVCGLPSYLGALGAFAACGAEMVGVPLDDRGMKTDLLEQRLVELRRRGARVKFVYAVPDFQNPSGVTLDLKRREELLAIAREFDLLVIEDSPYRQLRYVGETLPSLAALDRDDRVVSLFTFSKLLFPGLRLGWITAHEAIIDRLVVAKQPVDLCTNGLSQLIVREYLKGGRMPAQIERIRSIYAVKREALLSALDRFVDPEWGVQWTRPEGGLFLWMTLPREMDAAVLLERALAEDVAFVTGRAFHCDGSGSHTLRLNFSYPSVTQLETAARRLSAAIGTMIRETEAAGPQPPAELVSALPSADRHVLEQLAWSLTLTEVVE